MSLEDLTDKLIRIAFPPPSGNSVVIVGSQWGDEGKGKQVDLLAGDADYAVRYNGGPNAGHGFVYEIKKDGIVIKEVKIDGHLVPSSAANLETEIALTDGTAIPPRKLLEEMSSMPKEFNLEERLYVSENANIITPMHVWEDSRHERSGKGVGSTRNGIRPCYEDRAGRRAVTFGDILYRPAVALQQIRKQIEHWNYTEKTAEEVFMELAVDVIRLKDNVTNTSIMLDEARKAGKKILFEGAQGTLLDVYQGSYRFVTSSNVIAGGACTGAGVGPTTIDHVIGIVKLVMTRVGDGPFPSELVNENLQKRQLLEYTLRKEGLTKKQFDALSTDEMNRIRKKWSGKFQLPEGYNFVINHMSKADEIFRMNIFETRTENNIMEVLKKVTSDMRVANDNAEYKPADAYHHVLGMWMMHRAQEYGATTGRPRRTGWLDIAALRHSVRVNGLTGLALTKLDCLGDLPFVKILTHYEIDGKVYRDIPFYHLDKAVPKYETLQGWSSEEVKKARSFAELPANAQKYILRIAELTGTPVYSIGVGPRRAETINLFNPFTGEGIYKKAA